ncbi:hypothetical protein H5410_063143 [Solanum commersonii]|uniref:Uncharacterized protein n=1 Tax=Solanum commersonii TaxID=4109 RepID=A0A9J5WCH4_SOLCO|nr:hypothetical protein H5410_063143 [Solanum commersonii]
MYSISSATSFIEGLLCLLSSKQLTARKPSAFIVSNSTLLAPTFNAGSTASIILSSSTNLCTVKITKGTLSTGGHMTQFHLGHTHKPAMAVQAQHNNLECAQDFIPPELRISSRSRVSRSRASLIRL